MLTQPVENKIEYIHRRGFGKSVAHAEIQHYLKKQIPEIELEKTLGNRRADGVWEAKKIVFEIQLSPLTRDQAAQRSHDYATIGYQVVWLLHEGIFNRSDVSIAEQFLRENYPTYFTNGVVFYDQIEVLEGGKRRYRGAPLPIQIASPCTPFLKIPGRQWTLHLLGDLHTWCAIHGIQAFSEVTQIYQSPRGWKWWLQWIGFRILECVSKNAK